MSFHRSGLTALGAALLLGALPSTAVAGPPWISIELPANPLNPTTRGAYLLVHTYHHADAISAPLTGRAIGMIGSRRDTVALSFERTSVPGVYALRQTWGSEGTWALAITLGEGSSAAASALVAIAGDGEVRGVRVPTRTNGRDTWPRAASDDDVEHMLTVAAAAPVHPAPEQARFPLGTLLVLPAAAAAGLAIRRRRC